MSEYLYAGRRTPYYCRRNKYQFSRAGIAVVTGMIVCVFLIAICNGDDCGCGGFDTSPPDYGWNSPGFSGPDTPASSNGGSAPDGAGAEHSESGGSSGTGNSASDSGSSGGSSTGGVSGSESSSDSALLLAVKGSDYFREGDMNQSLSMLNKSLSIDPYSVRAWMTKGEGFVRNGTL